MVCLIIYVAGKAAGNIVEQSSILLVRCFRWGSHPYGEGLPVYRVRGSTIPTATFNWWCLSWQTGGRWSTNGTLSGKSSCMNTVKASELGIVCDSGMHCALSETLGIRLDDYNSARGSLWSCRCFGMSVSENGKGTMAKSVFWVRGMCLANG